MMKRLVLAVLIWVLLTPFLPDEVRSSLGLTGVFGIVVCLFALLLIEFVAHIIGVSRVLRFWLWPRGPRRREHPVAPLGTYEPQPAPEAPPRIQHEDDVPSPEAPEPAEQPEAPVRRTPRLIRPPDE